MKRFLRCVLVLIFPINLVHGQELPKWEVGADLLWLINKNTLPKYSVLAKRLISPKSAVRLRGGINFTPPMEDIVNDYDRKEYYLRGGYEKRKMLSGPKLSLIYGVDALYRYQRDFFYDLSGPVNNPYLLITTEEFGASVFVGVRFSVHKNISLSTESSFQATRNQTNKIRIGVGARQYDYPSFQSFPLNTINIGIHF